MRAFLIFLAAGIGTYAIRISGVMLLGDIICLAFGYAWLLAMASGASWIDPNNVMGSAFAVAVQPFLLWDALKMVFAAVTVTGAWSLLHR